MGRFLNPGHVCLLSLISLYLRSHISNDASQIVLEVISQQIVVPLEDSRDDAGKFSRLHTLYTSSLASVLRQRQQDIHGRRVYNILIERLWSIADIDGLTILFDETSSIFDNSSHGSMLPMRRISRASPLGQFIRRCSVEFTRLPFSDSLDLWHSFVTYRAMAYQGWEAKDSEDSLRPGRHVLEANLDAQILEAPDDAKLEYDIGSNTPMPNALHVEELLTGLVLQLQKFGTRIPDDIKDQIKIWLSSQCESGTRSLSYFISFFDHWKAGQYLMALESIHRYFDYSLAAKSAADNMRAHYQYALLHLSILHADFRCWDESVDAMNECIATARENQDTACLNFALSWLLYLRNANRHRSFASHCILPDNTENGDVDEMTFLRVKAKESKQWSLMSSTLLEQAKFELRDEGSLVRAQEFLLQATCLNNQHDLRTLVPVVLILYAASLERLGHTHVAIRTLDSIVSVHANHCSLSDQVRGVCRLAYLLASRGDIAQAISVLNVLPAKVARIPQYQGRVTTYLSLIRSQQYACDEWSSRHCLTPQLVTMKQFDDPELP